MCSGGSPGHFPIDLDESSQNRVSPPPPFCLIRAAEGAFACIHLESAAQMPILRLFTREMPHPAIVPQSAARGTP